ncbi:tRNA (guanine(46)-N(7))-methyltransferase TrmB [Paraglaciecola aestuariivivens]
MQHTTRFISTNQLGIHPNLEKVVKKQLTHASQKPISAHTQQAFEQAMAWLGDWQGEIILDSCCGVGESTVNIAVAHPQAKVIGVDKSALRTHKHRAYAKDVDNYLMIRADLNDFLPLLVQAKIKLSKHYLLYPNPYPKSAHLQRRWYATSVLADMLKLGGRLEVRSNWQLYVQEFCQALQMANISCQAQEYKTNQPITPFERKYWQSGQSSWRLIVDLNS